jgi:dihydropteroate synthase
MMPCGVTATHDAGTARVLPLAGGPFGFTHLDVFIDDAQQITVTRIRADAVMEYVSDGDREDAAMVMTQLTTPRPDFAGLSMADYHVIGIINTTPDSFSDGGDHWQADKAIAGASAMVASGAAVLDIGGESTRPGAQAVDHDEECRRILPVIKTLSQAGYVTSADTRHAPVMAEALNHGAVIINDVSGLRGDGVIDLIAEKQVPVIIMHMQGKPRTMQKNPKYRYAPLDIFDWLGGRIEACEDAGIPRHLIAIDPGFGFGKTPQHNMQIMAHLALYHGLGVPIVLGVSRKSTIAHFSQGEDAKDRMSGSVAMAAMGRAHGVQMFRVHDVAETLQALANVEALIMEVC